MVAETVNCNHKFSVLRPSTMKTYLLRDLYFCILSIKIDHGVFFIFGADIFTYKISKYIDWKHENVYQLVLQIELYKTNCKERHKVFVKKGIKIYK